MAEPAPRLAPSPAARALTCSGGSEAAAGSAPSRSPAARLIPGPYGLAAHGGAVALGVFVQDGVRVLRLAVHGQAVDVECDDDARACLVALLAVAPR